MARGWESKSIEAQQEEAQRSGMGAQTSVDTEEQRRRARRGTLALARARIVADLAVARTPAHRAMLEKALAAVEGELRDDEQAR